MCGGGGLRVYDVRMLPKSRVLAILSLGMGCLLLGVGLLLPRLIEEDRPFPLDPGESRLTVVDPAATIGKAYLAGAGDKDPDVVTGSVSRNWAISFGEPADSDEAATTVGVTTMRDDMAASFGDQAALLDAEVWTLRADRRSGAVVGDVKVADSLGSPATEAAVDGQWLAFPRDTRQQEYPFFDTLLRRSVPATFDRTEETDGHEVYVFRQELIAEPVLTAHPGYARLTQQVMTSAADDDRETHRDEGADQGTDEGTDEDTGTEQGGEDNSDEGAEAAKPATVTVSTLHRSGSREISVEPSSGMIVGVREDLRDYYAAADGTETGLLLDMHGDTPAENREALLEQAIAVAQERPVKAWGVVLAVIGAIVTLAGTIGALRPQRGTAGAAEER